MLPDVVRHAHAADLRVFAHVESAADFGLAVEAGVDEVNHLPGFRGPAPDMPLDVRVYEIAEDVARRAAARGVVVVTTLSGIEEIDPAGPMASLRKDAEGSIAAL